MEPITPRTPTNLPPELVAAAIEELKADAAAPPPPMAPVSDESSDTGPIRVGPLVFRAPVLGDVETLRLLGSPYHARFCPPGAAEVREPDLGALVDAAYLWSQPPDRCLALAQKGAAAFRKVSSASAGLLDAPLGEVRYLHGAVEAVMRGVG